MGFANVRSEDIVRSNNYRQNYKPENLHTDVAYSCIITTFSGIKEKKFDSSTLVYICLHSSSDSSTLVYWLVCTRLYSLVTRLRSSVYTRLVTCFHSSTFVYIRLWLVYIRLYSPTLV